MHGSIPTPSKGDRPMASWARAVTDVCNSMRTAGAPGMLQRDGAGAFGAAPVPANQRNRRGTAQPLPYEVAWDDSLDEGDGAWKIYLPNEHLLMVGTDYVIPNGTKAIPDIECWMQLDEIQADSDHVWLNVTINETGPSSAVFEPSDKTDKAAGIVGICIAEIAYDEETSSATVKQSVVGALVVVTAGKQSSVGLTGDYNIVVGSEYDTETHKLVNKVSRFSYTNGLLTGVSEQTDQEVFEAVPHQPYDSIGA